MLIKPENKNWYPPDWKATPASRGKVETVLPAAKGPFEALRRQLRALRAFTPSA
jgi:hypothetical protein